jgi:hypothetical protein
MPATLIVLFNLRQGKSPEDYERWAVTTDIKTVKALGSVGDFKLYKADGLLMSDEPSPYQYAELIHVSDIDAFGADVSSDTMKRVAAEFQEFADSPLFILTHDVEARLGGA